MRHHVVAHALSEILVDEPDNGDVGQRRLAQERVDSRAQRQDRHGGKERAPAEAPEGEADIREEISHAALGRVNRPKG
jgi:hypothetical protein